MNINTLQGETELSVIQKNASIEQTIVMGDMSPSIAAFDSPKK
jgi:hypothetical protein